MSRAPPIAPKDLTPEQKRTADEASEYASSAFGDRFTYKRSDGAFIGPFAPWLYTPSLLGPLLEVLGQMSKIPGLPPSAREVAILATGSHFDAAYEIYSHERIAAVTTSLSRSQIDQIKVGKKPDDLSEEEAASFDVATELLRKKGPLSDESWERAKRCFGREGTLALIHFVGFYCYICVFLNGCDVPLPKGEHIN